MISCAKINYNNFFGYKALKLLRSYSAAKGKEGVNRDMFKTFNLSSFFLTVISLQISKPIDAKTTHLFLQ